MYYRYETHCHCSECSACSRSTAAELVRAYHAAGYAGLVLTDHFIHGNTAVDRSLPWQKQMQQFYDAYLSAKAVGDELDFDVIFAIEDGYGAGKEVLIYGIDLPFLLANPDLPRLTLDELTDRVHSCGGIVVHAHPYRDRGYIDMSVEPRTDVVDGIEVYNLGNQPGEDRKALALADKGSYILTAGGDIHSAHDPRIGQAGIVLPYRVHNEKELVAALKRGDQGFLVGGVHLPVLKPEDLP